MPTDNIEALAQKRKKLEAQLREIKAAEEAERNKRLAIAGEAVLAEAEGNDEFKATLHAILDRRIKSKRKRALFGIDESAV